MATPATIKTSDAREQRSFCGGLELRAEGDGESGRTTKGYACLFDNVTSIGGYWQERFAKGAFSKSLGERDVVALHSHDDGRPMGRMSRDTLRVTEDDKGLGFENDLPDTQDGRDLATSIDRGDIEGMSFRFRALKEEWDETQDRSRAVRNHLHCIPGLSRYRGRDAKPGACTRRAQTAQPEWGTSSHQDETGAG